MLKTLIPAWVPADIAVYVSAAELAPDRKWIRRELAILEIALGHYVAAYDDVPSSQRGTGPQGRTGLCALFESASLTSQQLAIIRDAESRHPGIVFVAYRRPLSRRKS
jgi:hypothetical protein